MNGGVLDRIASGVGFAGAALVRTWIRVRGRTVRMDEAAWLEAPIGPADMDGDTVFEEIADATGLDLERSTESGLLASVDHLKCESFDPDRIDPDVVDFYENTASYHLDVWSETRFPGRPFLWLLVNTISSRMNQLAFPILGLEVSHGLSSDIVGLRDGSETRYTGWYRPLVKSCQVMFAGFYSTGTPPKSDRPCVKVVFPLPRGNATVFLEPSRGEGGSLHLETPGTRFGESGYYRVVDGPADRRYVWFNRYLDNDFHVYVDENGVPRCDHVIRFLNFPMLKLHYRMT